VVATPEQIPWVRIYQRMALFNDGEQLSTLIDFLQGAVPGATLTEYLTFSCHLRYFCHILFVVETDLTLIQFKIIGFILVFGIFDIKFG
jgi:hypothetical protein